MKLPLLKFVGVIKGLLSSIRIKQKVKKLYFKITKKKLEFYVNEKTRLILDSDVFNEVKKELEDLTMLSSLMGYKLDWTYRGLAHGEYDLILCIGGNVYTSPYMLYFTVDDFDKVFDISFRNRLTDFRLSSNCEKEKYAFIIETAKLQIT